MNIIRRKYGWEVNDMLAKFFITIHNCIGVKEFNIKYEDVDRMIERCRIQSKQ